MRKNATKFAAFALSMAMAVTCVNVPSAQAATKTKLNVTKKTLYTTGTAKMKATTLKVTKGGKKVTATFKSSKKSVATVSKTGKVTAKKAGKATITAKYAGKSYKCTVTVKNVSTLKVSTTKKSLVAGKTYTIKPTVTGTDKGVTYKSSKTSVATVSSAGKVTAKKAGSATITVTTKGLGKSGKKLSKKVTITVTAPVVTPTATPTPTVTPTATPGAVATAPSIVATTTNNVGDQKNTVIAGSNGFINFTVKDAEGNPIANEMVTVSSALDEDFGTFDSDYTYKLDGDNNVQRVKTDANGIAKVVLAPSNNIPKDKKDNAIASYKINATCDSNNATTEMIFKVAAVKYGPVSVVTPDATKNKLLSVRGTNAEQAGTTWSAQTNNINGATTDYVGTQQVSAANSDVHRVQFKSAVELQIPGDTSSEGNRDKYVQKIDKTSKEYTVYANDSETIKLDKTDLTNVQYATLYFNNIKLSKYTRLQVLVDDDNTANAAVKIAEYGNNDAKYDISNQVLQIPVSQLNGKTKIILKLVSEGQVNKETSVGWSVKDLTYVYKAQSVNAAKVVPLTNATVEWSKDDATYTTSLDVKGENFKNVDKTSNFTSDGIPTNVDELIHADDGESATFTLPAFPHVGNAIITVYKKDKTVKAYYAVATENNYDGDTHKYKNQNVINPNAEPYMITKDEAEVSSDATIKSEGGVATVNATKSGTTFIKGTVSCSDKDIEAALSDSLYSYVMWNPIPNGEQTSTNKGMLAISGQEVKLVAQLYDKNGNKVTKANEPIKFVDQKDVDIKNYATLGNDYEGYGTGLPQAAQVSSDASLSTDSNGQAYVTLKANSAVDVLGLKAVSQTGSTAYNVKLLINGEEVEKADLYWVDLALSYKDMVDGTEYTTKGNDNDKTVEDTKQIYAKGESWDLGSKVVVDGVLKGGVFKNKAITVSDGIKTNVSSAANSVGTVTVGTTNGMANVKSDKVGSGALVNAINSASVGSKVTFSVPGAVANTFDSYVGVGTGTANVNEKLTIDYKVSDNEDHVELLNINGNKTVNNASGNTDLDLYLKVTDQYGKAADVTGYKVVGGDTAKITLAANYLDANGNPKANPASNGFEITAIDNTGLAAGIIKVTVRKNAAITGASSIDVKAKVNGKVSTVTTAVFTDSTKNPFFGIDETKKAYCKDGKIYITFTNDIEGSSASLADEFKVKHDDSDVPVTDVKVDGNQVILSADSLQKADFTTDKTVMVTFAGATSSTTGCSYKITDKFGQNLPNTDAKVKFGVTDKTFKVYTSTDTELDLTTKMPTGTTALSAAKALLNTKTNLENLGLHGVSATSTVVDAYVDKFAKFMLDKPSDYELQVSDDTLTISKVPSRADLQRMINEVNAQNERDAAAVEAVKTALTLTKSTDASTLEGLVATKDGASIRWVETTGTAKFETVVDTKANVKSAAENGNATFVATITKGTASVTKTFTVSIASHKITTIA